MRLDEVGDLSPTLTSVQAAELLGVSVDHLWALARSGEAPVVPLRLGRTYRWPTARLLALLGLSATEGAASSWWDTATPPDPDPRGGPDVHPS